MSLPSSPINSDFYNPKPKPKPKPNPNPNPNPSPNPNRHLDDVAVVVDELGLLALDELLVELDEHLVKGIGIGLGLGLGLVSRVGVTGWGLGVRVTTALSSG